MRSAAPGPESPDSDAQRAIDENDEDALRDAISRGASLGRSISSLLDHAVGKQNARLCRVLIAAGADVNDFDPKRRNSPLYRACHYGSPTMTACVRCLVDAGADVNVVATCGPGSGRRPLHIACERGNSHMVQYLIDHDAEIDAKRGNTGLTALQYALLGGRRQNLLTMLRAGATLKIAKHADLLQDRKHKEAMIMLNDYLIDIVNEGGWDARVRRHQGGLLSVVSRCVGQSLPDDVKLSIVSFWSLPH